MSSYNESLPPTILHNTLYDIPFKCHNCLTLAMCKSIKEHMKCMEEIGEWSYMIGFDYFCILLRRLDAKTLLVVDYSVDYSYMFDQAIEILTLEIHALLYDGRIICFDFGNESIYDTSKAYFDDGYREEVIDNMRKLSTFYANLTEYHKKYPPES